jgi:hypothetical protein
MSTSWSSLLRNATVRARRWQAVSAGVGVAALMLVGGALPANGETGPSSGSGEAASCPSHNPPNELTLAAGTPQTATLGTTFATNLQVAFANSNGCPVTTAVAGIPVTFSASATGAGGLFSASGSNAVTVGSDASGMASAPPFTANYLAGSYTITASSVYGSVLFSLTNVEDSTAKACGTASSAGAPAGEAPAGLAGEPTKLTAGVGVSQSARLGSRFPIHFAVTVTDAEKNPVPGVLVTFTAPTRGPSGFFTVRSGGAYPAVSPRPSAGTSGVHTSHSHRIEAKTDACGIALAPAFTANRRAGGYVVVASIERMKAAFALVNEGR